MKKINQKRYFAILAIIVFAFSACKKVKTPEPMGDAGQTLVKIIGGGTAAAPGVKKSPIDFVNTPTTLVAADIRRDIPNSTELDKVMNITVKNDDAAVAVVNPAYIILPAAWYTIGSSTPYSGGNYSVTMKPGEFAKEIMITIPNATLLNPSALYALGFTITTADANGVVSSQRTLVIEIGAKNNWDGVYEMSGTFLDVTNAAFTYAGDQQYSLITVGASECIVRNDDLNGGIPGYIFSNAGSGTYYGAYGLVISFNPATGSISDLHNYYGDPRFPVTGGGDPAAGTGPPLYAASNGRRAILDPTGVNAAQGNRDILIKHILVHPAAVPTPPNYRTYFNETWKYLHGR